MFEFFDISKLIHNINGTREIHKNTQNPKFVGLIGGKNTKNSPAAKTREETIPYNINLFFII